MCVFIMCGFSLNHMLITPCRLSGIIHVLYEAMNKFLPPSNSDSSSSSTDDENVSDSDSVPPLPPAVSLDAVRHCIISEDEAQMSVELTEYFQNQRKVYEQVSD